MPAKKNPESQAEQSQRFRIKVKELIDAGELNPTDADAALDKLVRKAGNSTDS
jgi:polyhydroxyalkanoate synthesis regulator phasin